MSKPSPTLPTPSFYARLFCSTEQQALLDAAADLYREITSIPHRVSDSTVAHAKLAWWRNELVPGNGEDHRHPLCRAYFEQVEHTPLHAECFDAIIAGVEDRIRGLQPDSEPALATHCHKAMGAYMELLASLTLNPGQLLSPETRMFASLVGAGTYLSSHAIACAAHDRPSELAAALTGSLAPPADTIRVVLLHAAGLMDRAAMLAGGGHGLIYHHALLKIHQRTNSKALSRAKLIAGKPTRLTGLGMLACAWQGARTATARKP